MKGPGRPERSGRAVGHVPGSARGSGACAQRQPAPGRRLASSPPRRSSTGKPSTCSEITPAGSARIPCGAPFRCLLTPRQARRDSLVHHDDVIDAVGWRSLERNRAPGGEPREAGCWFGLNRIQKDGEERRAVPVRASAAPFPAGPLFAGDPCRRSATLSVVNPESTDRSLRGRAAGLAESSAGVPAFARRCRSEEPSLSVARGR